MLNKIIHSTVHSNVALPKALPSVESTRSGLGNSDSKISDSLAQPTLSNAAIF